MGQRLLAVAPFFNSEFNRDVPRYERHVIFIA